MPDQPPAFAQDYAPSAVQARYGYFASVLRPGMSKEAIKTAINDFQRINKSFFDQGRVVATLTKSEIDQFNDKYEIVASSSQLSPSSSTGLDALVLRERGVQHLVVAFGGVGPFQNFTALLGEGKDLSLQAAYNSFPVRELLAFKSLFDPLLPLFPNGLRTH